MERIQSIHELNNFGNKWEGAVLPVNSKSSREDGSFGYSNITSDQHRKQLPPEWSSGGQGLDANLECIMQLASGEGGYKMIRRYLESVFKPKNMEGASSSNMERLMLRQIVAKAMANCSDLSTSREELSFLSHQAIGDVEAAIPGVAGEVTAKSVFPAFGGKFGAQVCCPKKHRIGGFVKQLIFIHENRRVALLEEFTHNQVLMALQGHAMAEDGLKGETLRMLTQFTP